MPRDGKGWQPPRPPRAAGVHTGAVNYETGQEAVGYGDAQIGVGQLIRSVREAGYDCGKASVTFNVTDLHYAPSVAPLEQALRRVKGVLRVAANQATEHVTVDYVPGAVLAEDLQQAVPAPRVPPPQPIAPQHPPN